MIGGFIVNGTGPKKIVVRALGPSLQENGIAEALTDPTIELHAADGTVIGANDDWQSDAASAAAIQSYNLEPKNDREAALFTTLPPGSYTAVVAGKDGESGAALVDVYDVDAAADSKLANISTRGVVGSGDNVMIGGFIVGGASGNARVIVRGVGPSLGMIGVSGALRDPKLEVYDSNGALIHANSGWRDEQQSVIESSGVAPSDDREPAIVCDLTPGAYTAVLSGENGETGIALVEMYNLQ